MAAAGIFRFSDIKVFGLKLTASSQATVISLAILEGACMAGIGPNGIQAVQRGQIEPAR